MRIWSIHPKYLDTKGLVALWRETLLAQHVLEGRTKGYKNHPQLDRFKQCQFPVETINQYLSVVYEEATIRGFNFNKNKIDWSFNEIQLSVTRGQLNYEWAHLLKKLKLRYPEGYHSLLSLQHIETHPLFDVKPGEIEDWEIL